MTKKKHKQLIKEFFFALDMASHERALNKEHAQFSLHRDSLQGNFPDVFGFTKSVGTHH